MVLTRSQKRTNDYVRLLITNLQLGLSASAEMALNILSKKGSSKNRRTSLLRYNPDAAFENLHFFIGRAPSSATPTVNDKTVTRLVNYAKEKDIQTIGIINLTVARCKTLSGCIRPEPKQVNTPEETMHLVLAVRQYYGYMCKIIAAWGTTTKKRDKAIRKMIKTFYPGRIYCLAKNVNGSPRSIGRLPRFYDKKPLVLFN